MYSHKQPSLLLITIVLGIVGTVQAESYVFANAGVEGYGTSIDNTYTGTSNLTISNQIQQGNASLGVSAGLGHRISMAPYFFAIEVGSATKPEQFSDKQTSIVVKGSDKQLVGMVVSKIKSLRPPEPYKGKGIKEKGQYILRKEGKKK